jgi:hypothetical protein
VFELYVVTNQIITKNIFLIRRTVKYNKKINGDNKKRMEEVGSIVLGKSVLI